MHVAAYESFVDELEKIAISPELAGSAAAERTRRNFKAISEHGMDAVPEAAKKMKIHDVWGAKRPQHTERIQKTIVQKSRGLIKDMSEGSGLSKKLRKSIDRYGRKALKGVRRSFRRTGDYGAMLSGKQDVLHRGLMKVLDHVR